MRKSFLSIPLMLALAGCASFPGITLPGVVIGPTVPVSGDTPGAAIVNNAISLAGTFCGIGPTAASIINIFVSNSLLTSAEDLARAFCAAITPKATARTRKGPLLRGAVLTGTYRGERISGHVL